MIDDIFTLKPITLLNTPFEEAEKLFHKIYDFTEYDKNFLEKLPQEYFTDPASTKFHNCWEHGLLYHSINIAILSCKNLLMIRKSKIMKSINILDDEGFNKYVKETVFSALFHDICKIGSYHPEDCLSDRQQYKIELECRNIGIDPTKYIKKLGKTSGSTFIDRILNGATEEELSKIHHQYKYYDSFDIGHGEASVIKLLRLGVELSDDQIVSIRYHMAYFDMLFDTKMRNVILNFIESCAMLRCIVLAEVYSQYLFEKIT